jgi:acetolactate synthase small subunit
MLHVATSLADNYLPATTCFSIHAGAEPGVMPRVLELFAKRGLVPSHWESRTFGDDHSELTIDIQMRGLERETVDYMAACLRQIAFVKVVLTA